MKNERLKVQPDTIIRTVVLIVALINQILNSTGYSPIPVDDNQLTELITLVFTIAASVWAWWKNNSFTSAAIRADNQMKMEKELGL